MSNNFNNLPAELRQELVAALERLYDKYPLTCMLRVRVLARQLKAKYGLA